MILGHHSFTSGTPQLRYDQISLFVYHMIHVHTSKKKKPQKKKSLCCLLCYVCVRPGIQSEDQNQFFTFKVRTF